MSTITTQEQLRELYRTPSKLVQAKKTAVIDATTREIVEASPFFLLATADADGRCDVSPRGGPPGQLIVLDEHRVAFPDLSGNNLIDSLSNIVDNPQAGLLVLTPGTDETLRIDGRATISVDPELLDRWADQLRTPKCAVIIEVEHTFLHCAKAFRRGRVWDPSSWAAGAALPDHVNTLISAIGLDATADEIRAGLEQGYAADLEADKPELA